MSTDGMPVLAASPEDGPWIGMRRACEILGVNQSTLRAWTDSGRVPVFLTPGGHRRYREADLRALVESSGGQHTEPLATALLASHERYEQVARTALSSPWFQRFDAPARRQFRLLGVSMLNLLTTHLVATTSPERDDALVRGRELAAEYGEMANRLGLTLAEATEAFLLFRNPVLETVHQWLGAQTNPTRHASDMLSRVNHFMDQVLVVMTAAHERGAQPGANAAR
ncbi:MAG: helix-turn-helix domain-containing protein [Chloroflexi bacterium]|nr:helix-turn-helix domain-containing protein [Chloroflexota bacterium]